MEVNVALRGRRDCLEGRSGHQIAKKPRAFLLVEIREDLTKN
jgi:hypothetical protein